MIVLASDCCEYLLFFMKQALHWQSKELNLFPTKKKTPKANLKKPSNEGCHLNEFLRTIYSTARVMYHIIEDTHITTNQTSAMFLFM